MDIKEINERLVKGEKLFCPECDLFTPPDHCEIIMCANPFAGCSDLDIEAYSNLLVNCFDKD